MVVAFLIASNKKLLMRVIVVKLSELGCLFSFKIKIVSHIDLIIFTLVFRDQVYFGEF